MLIAHIAGLPVEETGLALAGGIGWVLLLNLRTITHRIRRRRGRRRRAVTPRA